MPKWIKFAKIILKMWLKTIDNLISILYNKLVLLVRAVFSATREKLF